MIVSTQNIQWENENSLRKYPLSEDATCIDDSGLILPTNILTELVITGFVDVVNPRISSLFLGPEIVSLSISDDKGAVASMTARRAKISENTEMDPFRPGVVARVSFSASAKDMFGVYRFSTPAQSAIHPFCVFVLPRTGVLEFVDDVSGNRATGDVVFAATGGIVPSVDTSDGSVKITLTASSGVSRSLSTGCSPTDLNESCAAPVIQTIDGVAPDRFGNIALVLE